MEAKMNRQFKRWVHAGKFAAEVTVELIPDDNAWGPYLSLDDALRLDDVRAALERGDVAAASKLARVYKLTPVKAAE
jgi:hypothetical protein